MGRRHISLLAIASFASLLAAPGHAFAEPANACAIKPPSDGFAALRKAPSARSPIVTRIQPGHVLVIEKTEEGVVKEGKWLKASYFPGEAMPSPGAPGSENIRQGWVHAAVVENCG